MEIRTAVILAGGRGTRLPISGRNLPKLLISIIDDKTILDFQVERLLAYGIADIRLSIGHLAEKTVAWVGRYRGLARIRCVIEKEPLGTGGGIKLAAAGLTEPFFAFNADNIADFDFRSLAAHAAAVNANVLVGRHVEHAEDYGILEVDEAGRISSFLEKPHDISAGLVNAGCYVLNPNILESMSECFSIEKDLFPRLVAKKRLHYFHHRGRYWFDCGTEERLVAVRKFFLTSYAKENR